MATTIDKPPASLDDVAIVRTFVTPGRFSAINDLFSLFTVSTSIHGDSAALMECKVCFCLIGMVEEHYKASHPDFDLEPYYRNFVYKATHRMYFTRSEEKSKYVWYEVGEVK